MDEEFPATCPICGGLLCYIRDDYGFCIDPACNWSTPKKECLCGTCKMETCSKRPKYE